MNKWDKRFMEPTKQVATNIDESKIIKLPSRLVKEGTVGDCPECGSTTIKRFMWFGMSIGCIQPDCDNYYRKYAD